MTTPLIVPVGPPGCGKSTLAHKLQILGVIDADAIVCPDDYRRILTGDRANQTCNGRVFDICETIATIRLRHSLPVYWDATNLSFAALNQMAVLAQNGSTEAETEAGFNAVARFNVLFHVSYEELIRRNNNRDHPVPNDVLERMYHDYQTVKVLELRGATITPNECLSWAEKGWLR